MTLDELTHLASRAEPPPLDDASARRMIERAAGAPRRALPAPTRSRLVWPALAAAIACIVGVWFVARRAPAEPALLHLTLPTGDRLAGIAGARFEVEQLTIEDRRLRLDDGAVLFEVAHAAPHQRFSVATPHLVAIATGTVFSVETGLRGSRVRVFEGSVEVVQAGERHPLVAGAAWDSTEHVVRTATVRPAAFDDEIAEALARRVSASGAGASSSVAPASAPAPDGGPRRADDGSSRSGSASPPTAASMPTTAATPHAASMPTTAATPHAASMIGAAATSTPASLDDLLAQARNDLARGDFAHALSTAKVAATRGATMGAWRVVTADALRGLGRAGDAAAAFDAAAGELAGLDAMTAAYSAAYLWFHDVRDGKHALASLEAAGVDATGSPLEERGLALHVQALVALERRDDARPLAARYVARFPRGDLVSLMRGLQAR